MKKELKQQLQADFPFMNQNNAKEGNPYRRWGCECSDGWYELIHQCCQQITEKYHQEDIEIDFVPAQIKEKFGTLRFYFGYEDAPCGIAAFDFLNDGTSIRFEPDSEGCSEKKKLFRREISDIVKATEAKSRTVCEFCGKETTVCLRKDLRWVKTLCDSCYNTNAKIKRKEN